MKNGLKIILSIVLVAVIQHQHRPRNKNLYVDNGKIVYQADCSSIGNTYDMGHCLKLAGKQCPAGFDILMQNEEVVGVKAEGDIKGVSTAEKQDQWNEGQGRNNSRAYFNANSKEGQTLSFSRYIIYTCKTFE